MTEVVRGVGESPRAVVDEIYLSVLAGEDPGVVFSLDLTNRKLVAAVTGMSLVDGEGVPALPSHSEVARRLGEGDVSLATLHAADMLLDGHTSAGRKAGAAATTALRVGELVGNIIEIPAALLKPPLAASLKGAAFIASAPHLIATAAANKGPEDLVSAVSSFVRVRYGEGNGREAHNVRPWVSAELLGRIASDERVPSIILQQVAQNYVKSYGALADGRTRVARSLHDLYNQLVAGSGSDNIRQAAANFMTTEETARAARRNNIKRPAGEEIRTAARRYARLQCVSRIKLNRITGLGYAQS